MLVPQTEKGLTGKGFEFLAEMERMHMIVDVSHLSDKGFWDIVEHGTRPLRPATPTAVHWHPTPAT